MPGESFDPSLSDRRILVLQEAKHLCLAEPVGLPILPLSPGPRRSPPDEVPPVSYSRSLGLSRRVSLGCLDSLERSRSIVVVRCSEPSCRSPIRVPISGPSILVQRVRSGLGCQFCRPVRLWSMVSRGASLFDQSEGVQNLSSWSPTLSTLLAESVGECILRHDGAFLHQKWGGGGGGIFVGCHAQLLLRWTESLNICLVPQFIMGARNVAANSLSRRHQVVASEWTLAQMVDKLWVRWPVMVDLFSTSVNYHLPMWWPVMVDLFAIFLNYRLPVYFSPLNDPMAVGTDVFFQSWDSLQTYAFPPFSLIRQVINKLQSCRGMMLMLVAPY